MTDIKLKQITHHLTGLELKIDNRRRTRLFTSWDNRDNKIVNQYIGFSKKQIDGLYYNLTIRGFEIENYDVKYIQVLLHEVAHFKKSIKYKNIKDYTQDYDINFNYHEKLADRYALRYFKKFI